MEAETRAQGPGFNWSGVWVAVLKLPALVFSSVLGELVTCAGSEKLEVTASGFVLKSFLT